MFANTRRRLRLVVPRLQFSLRALFVLTTIVAVWIGVVAQQAREQAAAVRLIREQGGSVTYDFQERPPGSGKFDPKARPGVPDWLVACLGVDAFSEVVSARLGREIWYVGESDVLNAPRESAVGRLPCLRGLRRLVIIDLQTEMTDESLRVVGKLHNLEMLHLPRHAPKVTDAGISHLAGLRKLKSLILHAPSITDESLKTLGKLRSLEGLFLTGGAFTARGMSHLGELTRLKTLDLAGRNGVTDEGVALLGGLVGLERLRLRGADVTSAGLEDLTRLQALRELDLSNNPRLDDEALRIIGRFSSLEKLSVRSTSVTSKGMKHLGRLKKLRVLDLSGNSGVADDGFAYVARLENLDTLRLHNSGVSSLAIKHLRELPKLRELDLAGNRAIDERAVVYLAGLAALEKLDLHSTRVNLTRENAGQLKKLTALESLNLTGTGSDFRAIQAALPRCFVDGSYRNDITEFLRGLEDYSSLTDELLRRDFWRQHIRRAVKLGKLPEGEMKEYIPSPEVLPPIATLKQMVALAGATGVDSTLAAQRPALEEFANAFVQCDGAAQSIDAARKLHVFATSDASRAKLYNAAIEFEFADAFSKHVERLERVRETRGLTKAEEWEYRHAPGDLNERLGKASQHLGFDAEASRDGAGEAIIRIWKETQHIAARVKVAGEASTRDGDNTD